MSGSDEAELSAARAVVLVEGVSDKLALEALAGRRGRELGALRVAVVAMGGAPAIDGFLARFGPGRLDVGVAGVCDAGEEPLFRRALDRAGFGRNLGRAEMERLGFFVCVQDLEDELIRSLGVGTVERIVDGQGELGSFRTMQKQRPWKEQPLEAQLRRFLGSAGGRKIAYAPLLVNALDLTRVPPALDGVLDHACGVAASP
jgi:hypothetical protein